MKIDKVELAKNVFIVITVAIATTEMMKCVPKTNERMNIPTIEERAKGYVNASLYDNSVTRKQYSYRAYIKGATEQKKIDIDKASEFLRNNIDPKLVIYHEETWCSVDEFVNKLRKSMEE